MKHIKRDFSLKAWVRACLVDLGGEAEVKIKLFQNMVMLHIKLKLTTLAATWLQIFCPQTHPQPRGRGQRSNHIFSESSHVAYQIKADDAGSNMVANILPTDTPSTQGMGSKGQTISFSESSHVAYQIKDNWAQSTMKANMLSFTHTNDPWGGVKRSFFFFSKSGHVAYQMKVEEV